MTKLLDKLADWVWRRIDWIGFCCEREQQDALHFMAAMDTDPQFRAVMQRLTEK